MNDKDAAAQSKNIQKHSFLEVFLVFLRLGLTSFGGPVAHIGYFREEFVNQRKWLSDKAYADLVALCQFLPGPASSQVGLAIGLSRAGYAGALAAWTAFTLPSAFLLAFFAFGLGTIDATTAGPWINGLKIAAVAVVANAVLGMAQSLAPDRERATLAVGAAILALLIPSALGQISGIIIGGLVGVFLLRDTDKNIDDTALPLSIRKRTGAIALIVFFILLFGLPLLAAQMNSQVFSLFDSFYRSGALVFGGGHVVLPLLQAEVVPNGLVTNEQFLAGYGAAQAIPGPLFTFSAYLGALINGWTGVALCLLAIFLPSALLVIGALPFWNILRRKPVIQSAMLGVNAAVVGLLLAALYNPVFTSGIKNAQDFALGITAFLMLFMWRVSSWIVVLFCALVAWGAPIVIGLL